MARVVQNVIIPNFELESGVVLGHQKDGVAVAVGAATNHGAAFSRGDFCVDDTLSEAEGSGIDVVSGDDDAAGIVADAIVPGHEFIAQVGCGFQLDGVAIGINAAACHEAGALGYDLRFDGALQATEEGDKAAVLRDHDVARVVGDAVVPHLENITFIGCCPKGNGVAIVIDAAFGHGSRILRVDGGCDGIVYRTEISGEDAVLCDDDIKRVVGDAVVPIEECIT